MYGLADVAKSELEVDECLVAGGDAEGHVEEHEDYQGDSDGGGFQEAGEAGLVEPLVEPDRDDHGGGEEGQGWVGPAGAGDAAYDEPGVGNAVGAEEYPGE